MTGRQVIPGSARRVTVTVNTPNLLTAAQVAGLDGRNGAQLAGRGAGYIRIGQPSPGGVGRFAGELGKLQDFRGGAFLGRTFPRRELKGSDALPMTGPPAGAPRSQMLDLILRAGS